MNRELKFRIWYYDQKKFDYNVELKDFSKYSFPLYWCKVQQYTGLKDRNGKEIYDGDILKHDIGFGPIYWKVIWDSKVGQWKTTKENGGNTGNWFCNYVVAGNTFENPDLLK